MSELAEREGFEPGLFPTIFNRKEIAENPINMGILSQSRS